ncbi:MAG: preprotein translocase subunit YajC [Clostridia bacterium]|nr:preprotein translocase subunit YajC [Clostridia bacterium]
MSTFLLKLFDTTTGGGTGTAAPETPKGNDWGTWVMLGAVVLLLIGFMIWSHFSNKKKQKQAQEKVDSLKVGDRVMTIGGICGFVAEINKEENTFVLKTGLNGNESYLKFDRKAIYDTAPAEGSAVAAKAAEKVEAKAEEKPAEEKKEAPKKVYNFQKKKAVKPEEKPAEAKAEEAPKA